jgi:probable rRNA maturation factor
MNKITVSKEVADRDITKKFVKEATDKILKELGLDNVEVSIALVGDERIRELNKYWRKKDKPTDVLSFPIDEKPPGYRYRILGDVVISIPYAKRQAEEIGFTPKEEILRLLIHGILHLLGYDHEKDEKEAEIMFNLQDKIFDKLKNNL